MTTKTVPTRYLLLPIQSQQATATWHDLRLFAVCRDGVTRYCSRKWRDAGEAIELLINGEWKRADWNGEFLYTLPV